MIFPLATSRASADNSRPSGVAVDTHTWSPMTIGDDQPRP